MYYLRFDKKTKRVLRIQDSPLRTVLDNYYGEAEFYGTLPDKYDYLTVTNLQEKTDTWTETSEETDILKSRTYYTCDLEANFRPPLTPEQIEAQKEAQYKKLCEKYIREKYSLSDELEMSRVKDRKPELFAEFDAYVEACLLRAEKEVYK